MTSSSSGRSLTADLRALVLAMVAARAPGATLCPSEVARAHSPGAWRSAMPAVHDAVDRLVVDGVVRLSWKGRPLATRSGPYRIASAVSLEPEPLRN